MSFEKWFMAFFFVAKIVVFYIRLKNNWRGYVELDFLRASYSDILYMDSSLPFFDVNRKVPKGRVGRPDK